MTTKATQMTKTTFVKRSAMWMGGLALLAGAPLSGCGTDMEMENLGSLVRGEEVSVGDTLGVGETLLANQKLVSANNKYRAILQEDGNFVVYRNDNNAVVWAANQYIPNAGWHLTLESTGNLVVRDAAGGLKWESKSFFNGVFSTGFLKLDNSGGLTVYSGSPDSPGEKRWLSKFERYAELAKKFRPVFNIDEDQFCEPLTFTESESGSSSHQNKCRDSFSSNFAVFASVADHPSDRSDSFRITYGVAFGWQAGTVGLPPGIPYAGAHGDDAQYIVVDVVDDRVISVWADLHKGYYARTAENGRGLTMYTPNNVTAWVGQFYNSLKLVRDESSVCKEHSIDPNISMSPALASACFSACVAANDCGALDTVLNWGDWVGEFHQNKPGKLVMTDHACAARTNQSYTSADGITYSTSQLAGLRNYIGCSGASAPWADGSSTFRSKNQATKPYELSGCNSGDSANGGDICNATHFSDLVWRTSKVYKNLYLDPVTAGSADVDYTAGSPFNDIHTIGSVPRSISIRTGARVDQVSVVYAARTTRYGGDGGSSHTLDGLETDPVVAVELCDGGKNGRMRVGHVKLVTRSGRYMEGGGTYDNCRYLQPSGKRFYGFYGRSGDEIDVLGTIWGDL